MSKIDSGRWFLETGIEARDPQTSSERLHTLFAYHPLEVVSNPNLSPEHMVWLTIEFQYATEEKPFIQDIPMAMAVLWCLNENPAFSILRLENPSHPVFAHLAKCEQRIRIRLHLQTLSKVELEEAYLQCLVPFLHAMDTIILMNLGNFRLWLHHISALWRRKNQLPLPSHYTFSSKQKLPVSGGFQSKVHNWMSQLRASVEAATEEPAYSVAFERLFRAIEENSDLKFVYQHVLETLDAASMGKTWPDPAEPLLLKIVMKDRVYMSRTRARNNP